MRANACCPQASTPIGHSLQSLDDLLTIREHESVSDQRPLHPAANARGRADVFEWSARVVAAFLLLVVLITVVTKLDMLIGG